LLIGHSIAAAAPKAKTAWLTATEARQPGDLRITWSGTTLREALRSLSENQRLAILLDRRVDPEQLVNVTLADVSPAEAVAQTASSRKLGMALLGPLAYVGPVEPTRQLRTIAALRKQEAQELPAAARQAALANRGTTWEDLATPRQILEKLAAEARVKLVGIDQVPHDLWGAADLPSMAWTDRLTAVAGQLGLTFEFDATGRKVTLVPIGNTVELERTYPAGAEPEKLVANWKSRAPDADIKIAGGRITVRGLVEDHERIQPPRATVADKNPPAVGRGAKNQAPGKKVHTLRAQDVTLESLMKQLEERLEIEFVYDAAAMADAGAPVSRRVSIDVKQATLEELLKALLDPLGLRFTIKGATITITPGAAREPK